MSNLRDKQITALRKMLFLGGREGTEDFNDQWKLLIYDEDSRDTISPIMNVGSLRQSGVTLHLLLNSERESISDAPAVYFVRPTEANIKRIIEDCSKTLYRSVYLNFLSRIERPLLEKLAQDLLAVNAISLISRVSDQYLDVISLEPSLFSLNFVDSFIAYNDTSLGEAQIRAFMNRVSMGILSMIRLLGVVPVIRAPSGGAAEMLSQSLHSLIRETQSPRGASANILSGDSFDRPRPLLLIFDRTCDMFPILQHTATYQALIDDLLGHHLNKVTIEVKSKDGNGTKKKSYDLNTQSDTFYNKYSSVPFPEAVEANEKELAEVSQKEAEIRSKPGVSAVMDSDFDKVDAAAGGGKDLSEAIESLPEILNRKANLEAHTNILQAVMSKVASREVHIYFQLEQSILSAGRVVDRSSVITLLKDGTKGQVMDKARLLLLTVVSGDTSINKAAQDELDVAFTQGCQALATPVDKVEIDKILSTAAFLRRLCSLQSPLSQRFGGGGGGLSSGGNAMFSSLLTSAQSRATSLMAKAAAFFSKFSPAYVTRVVDSLCEGRACPEDDSFCFLDPQDTSSNPPNRNVKYSEVIVFVVGGGCYSEFLNLQEYLKQKQLSSSYLKNIMYGCSEIISGDNFVSQLEKLSTKS